MPFTPPTRAATSWPEAAGAANPEGMAFMARPEGSLLASSSWIPRAFGGIMSDLKADRVGMQGTAETVEEGDVVGAVP